MKKLVFYSALGLAAIGIALALFLPDEQRVAPDQDIAAEIASFANSDVFINPNDLHSRLGEKNLVILDGSNPKNFGKEHIEGAISIGFKGLSRSNGKPGDPLWGTILPPEQLKAKLESFGITNNTTIVAYSDTFKGPGAGGRAVWQLRMAGLENVYLLYGGLPLWKQLQLPLTKEVVSPTPSSGLVLAEYNRDDYDTLEDIRDNLASKTLIDVRTQKEFTGPNTNNGESRPGHILGAKWLEWTDLLQKDGTPKSSETIIAMMAEVGVGLQDDFTLY